MWRTGAAVQPEVTYRSTRNMVLGITKVISQDRQHFKTPKIRRVSILTAEGNSNKISEVT